MFLAKEAVRLATDGTTTGVAREDCPPLAELMKRYEAAGGRYYVCPICFNAKKLSHRWLPMSLHHDHSK
jgi:predicted peroxiredoxin